MNAEEVLKRFAVMADLSLEESSPWVDFCADAAEDILLQLKDGVDIEANERRLTSAAASLSFYRYTLYRASGEGMNSFSVGDVKVTQNKKDSVNSAYQAWCNQRDNISDLIEDDHFLFRMVE